MLFRKYDIMDEKDDEKGGGAPPSDQNKTIEELKASNAALLSRLEKLEVKPADKPKNDDDLLAAAKKKLSDEGKTKGDQKALEAALTFTIKSSEFLKNNEALLPKDVAEIFKAAEKANYDTAIQKDSAIKSGIIQSFFSVQTNLDLLTPGMKNELEEYLKLTNTGKQEKAQQVFDMIFEPALEMHRRMKKAEALAKGHGSGDDDAYKTKMMNLSKKHYLGEKIQ